MSTSALLNIRRILFQLAVPPALLLVVGLLLAIDSSSADSHEDRQGIIATSDREKGRIMYMEGLLPTGERMSALIHGDIELTGEQVKCGTCHRRSGMGSSEGQQVVPAITGKLLFQPLQIPTSKPPVAPIQRPAYTRESLKLAIRSGIDAKGNTLDPNMPRYPLDDATLDVLIDYLDGMSTQPSPGVTEEDIHFATIVNDSLSPAKRKALLDTMQAFFEQKNTETRNESSRAKNAPWHKAWIFKPYRKWILHIWELQGPRHTWGRQLEAFYRQTPVFALISGSVTGNWAPIHHFCEKIQLPCLFPSTKLPVISDNDFYSLYMNRGMTLEGEGVARHIKDAGLMDKTPVQIFMKGDILEQTAAQGFRKKINSYKGTTKEYMYDSIEHLKRIINALPSDSLIVLWIDSVTYREVADLLVSRTPKRVYLATTLFGEDVQQITDSLRDQVFFIHTHEMPDRLKRLLARSTGWLRAKRAYSPEEPEIQANAYFAMKVAGEAMKMIRGYFFRDYFIEKIEHLVDNAPYTSVYPGISLAPGQRFVSKGYYIAKIKDKDRNGLTAVTEWMIP